jgi:hypothetical protein
VDDESRHETIRATTCGTATPLRDFLIGDQVTFFRPRVLRARLLTDERHRIHLEDAQTGEELEIAIDELTGKAPPDDMRSSSSKDDA